MRLAVAGIGNNISALLQGVYFYRELAARLGPDDGLPGIRRRYIGGLAVDDVALVAGFDVLPAKIGRDLREAVFTPPNNYPNLGADVPAQGVKVAGGLTLEDGEVRGHAEVVAELRRSKAEVLLYSLPTGLQWAAEAYARCSLEAGVALVNCTPEIVARDPQTLAAFENAGVPLIGDDLASHLGTSVVHRTLLRLLQDRGLTLASSYQLNFGGNEDFRNLLQNGGAKLQSKKNALAQGPAELDLIEVVPSAGYIRHLKDNKVAILNVEAIGWGGTPVSLDLKLKVQDSSNAAGVIIDLIRIAAAARRQEFGGFNAAAAPLLKSPPFGHWPDEAAGAEAALEGLLTRVAAE
jgi:myo-inositol-1-phosphate synthase